MSEVQETASDPAIVKAVRRLPPAEQQLLLAWARGIGTIRYGTLRGFKKAAAMLALTRDRKAAWPLLKVVSLAVKHILWDARSWTARLGVGAIVATLVATGNEAATIVAPAGVVGLPLWMWIGAGGGLIGLMADTIAKRSKVHPGG